MTIDSQIRSLIERQKTEDLEYIRCILKELSGMAAARRDRALTYLIEMAYLEASDRLRGRPDTSNQPNARAA